MKTLHVACILDRSGSMHGTEAEVIGAYNAFVEEQKKIACEKGIKTKMTLVLFDDRIEEVHSKTLIEEVQPLTGEVYFTRGMTSLYDAIGKTINQLSDKKNVIFFIETDGQENSSKEFNSTTIKNLVEQKKKDGWDFNFVGADLTVAATTYLSSSVGIDANKTSAFAKSAEGYAARNMVFASATMSYVDEKTKENT